MANPLIFFDGNEGGLVFYGGAIGGVISGVIYCYLRKIPVWKMADIGAPAIMLGLAIGRLGCFFAGCCHGMIVETDGHDHSVLMSFKGEMFFGWSTLHIWHCRLIPEWVLGRFFIHPPILPSCGSLLVR